MSENEVKVLIAVTSALLGYALGWFKEQVDRRQRRRALATALLADLRDLEESLHELIAAESAADGMLASTTEVRSKFFSELTLFRSETVAAVQDVYSFTTNVERILEAHAEGEMSSPEYSHWVVQLHARNCASCIGRAKSALEKEGGRLPAQKTVARWVEPELPNVPARYFPSRTKQVADLRTP
jgi:hypothetical protein